MKELLMIIPVVIAVIIAFIYDRKEQKKLEEFCKEQEEKIDLFI